MGKKKSKKKTIPTVAYGKMEEGMVVLIKKKPTKITKIHQMKTKKGGIKIKIFGIDDSGKEIKDVRPEDRRVQIMEGVDGKAFEVTAAAEEEEVEKKAEIDLEITSGSAGAALTVPIRAGEVRKGSFVLLKGKPCKVVEVSISKTGKHGHAKANITGLDVFTGKKYNEISPTSHNMVAPTMFRAEWQVTDISPDGEVTLMNEIGTTKEDLNLPKDTHNEYTPLSKDVIQRFNDCPDGKGVFVVVLKAMATEQIVDFLVKDSA